MVSCEQQSEVQRIRALKPTSMSWGNLCDSIARPEMHRLARACAPASTPHYMHSVNWSMDVKGTHVMDYVDGADIGNKAKVTPKDRIRIWQDAQQAVTEAVTERGAERLMRAAPLDNVISVCDVLLAQRMLPMWLQAFRAQAPKRGEGAVANCKVLHKPEYWMFSRSCSIVYFALQYK